VMAAIREYGARLLQQAQLGAQATAIGVDETAFTRATALKPTVFATDVVDLHTGKLIDVIEGRSRKVLADWLSDQPAHWAERIEVAALDPFRGYARPCRPDCRTRCASWTRFMWCGSGSPASTTCAAACSKTSWGIAAAAGTHCMARMAAL